MNYEKLEFLIREAGFVNVRTDIEYDLITGWLTKDGAVKSVSINGEKDFTKSSSYQPDAEVVITFHTFKKYEEN